MYLPEQIKCDVCETVHGKVNGWWLVDIQKNPNLMIIYSFNSSLAKETAAVCGENCLHAYISQNLSKVHGKQENSGVDEK